MNVSGAVCCRYKHQVMLARERFKATLGPEAARLIDINTIDGFQGREKDVAIFTCVRSNPKKGIGFVADFRRMNVGITRARASMLVVGSAAALKRDKHWAALIKHARATDCVFQVTAQQPRLTSGSPALFCFRQSCPERSFLLVVLLQHRCRARVLDLATSPFYFFLRRHTILFCFRPFMTEERGGSSRAAPHSLAFTTSSYASWLCVSYITVRGAFSS
jgi:hypothetical protein